MGASRLMPLRPDAHSLVMSPASVSRRCWMVVVSTGLTKDSLRYTRRCVACLELAAHALAGATVHYQCTCSLACKVAYKL
jgi:hypothetical protein